MKAFVIGIGLVGCAAGPALANECPLLQKQIDATIGSRFDGGAANARALAAQAWALHTAGKHAESVAKYDEAGKAAGITLTHKK
jgi:hypothetical protein